MVWCSTNQQKRCVLHACGCLRVCALRFLGDGAKGLVGSWKMERTMVDLDLPNRGKNMLLAGGLNTWDSGIED